MKLTVKMMAMLALYEVMLLRLLCIAQFYVERTNTPKVYFYPAADQTYTFVYYRIRRIQDAGIYTNTTQVDAYRGAGRPEAMFALERLMDRAARDVDRTY